MHDDDSRASADAAPANRCPRCGAGFTCGMQAGLPACWCAAMPPLTAIPDAAIGCYCPDCLKAFIGGLDDGGPS